MARQRKKHHFWRNLLILIVLFGIYLYWGNRSIETDEATFTSGALPAGFDGCRIVQLSDLHGKYFGKGNERLYTAVKAAQPEYIFVTGDLVDRKTENPTIYAGEVGAALSAIAPTYYVTGNHEWGHGTKVVEEIKRTLRILSLSLCHRQRMRHGFHLNQMMRLLQNIRLSLCSKSAISSQAVR